MIGSSVADFLKSGGSKSAKFDNPGDVCKGTVVAAEVRQQTEFGTGVPRTYDDGNPMMQLVVTLQTDQREDDEDDGRRNVYVKGAKKDPQSGTGALIAALTAAGATDLAEGGTLAVQFTGYGVATRGNPPRQWRMEYQPPAPVQTGGLLDSPTNDFAGL